MFCTIFEYTCLFSFNLYSGKLITILLFIEVACSSSNQLTSPPPIHGRSCNVLMNADSTPPFNRQNAMNLNLTPRIRQNEMAMPISISQSFEQRISNGNF